MMKICVSDNQGVSTFVIIRFRHLAPRGQITFRQLSQRATFLPKEHLLVGANQGASTFVFLYVFSFFSCGIANDRSKPISATVAIVIKI